MIDPRRFGRVGCISFDFDGVLATLVLGRAWAKTRARGKEVPVVSPALRGLKRGLAALTEGLRKPMPGAESSLRRLRSSGRSLCILTSRTGERIAAAERWLGRHGWDDLFERAYFNSGGEDADRFKARILGACAIDAHVDDDAETVARLSRLFPDRMFVHMNVHRRASPNGENIVAVAGWGEAARRFLQEGPP